MVRMLCLLSSVCVHMCVCVCLFVCVCVCVCVLWASLLVYDIQVIQPKSPV